MLPTITIIVPTRPGQEEIPALSASRHLDYPAQKIELLVARGNQPAVQRNHALRVAQGELIYFLDDDSRPLPGNLRRAVAHFAKEAVQMVGGPNVCPAEAPLIEQVFAVVLSSWLAFGPSRARYASLGQARNTTEKELILCNLLARRDSISQLGGFNESLYPNEENALMDELQKRGGTLVYDPDLIVYRRPRGTLKAFLKMLLNYGRGRAEQFRLHPTLGSALNFVPPAFCAYLLLAPFLGERGLLPLSLYGVALLAQTAVAALRHGVFRAVLAVPLIVVTHIFYGLGFWWGLFTRPKATKASSMNVQVERIELCGKS